jgi:hypothetical protein
VPRGRVNFSWPGTLIVVMAYLGGVTRMPPAECSHLQKINRQTNGRTASSTSPRAKIADDRTATGPMLELSRSRGGAGVVGQTEAATAAEAQFERPGQEPEPAQRLAVPAQ